MNHDFKVVISSPDDPSGTRDTDRLARAAARTPEASLESLAASARQAQASAEAARRPMAGLLDIPDAALAKLEAGFGVDSQAKIIGGVERIGQVFAEAWQRPPESSGGSTPTTAEDGAGIGQPPAASHVDPGDPPPALPPHQGIDADMLARVPLPVAVGVANGLALAETFNASFAGFANSEIAQVAGLVAAVLVTRLVRSVGVEWSAQRILRAGWRELARLAAARAPGDRTRFTVLMLDRAGLLVSRLALASPGGAFTAARALGELRVGLNLDGLQRARQGLAAGARGAVRTVLGGVARYYRRLAAAPLPPGEGGALASPPTPPASLLDELDVALAAALRSLEAEEAREGVRALVGLRRSLFPDSPPYAPHAAD